MEATPLTIQAAQETKSWMAGLPASFLSTSPAIRNIGVRVLAALRSERVEMILQQKIRQAAIGQGNGDGIPPPEPRLLSESVPGPKLVYPGELGEEDAEAVAGWYSRQTSPDAILQWDALAS
jgi:hypothetical protein